VAADATVPRERVEIRRVIIRERPAPIPEPFVDATVDEMAKRRVILETSLGPLTIEVFPDRAPNHARQFLRLAAAGVYDGTAFHRVVKGFVIQGGHMPTRREPPDERQETYIRTLQPEFAIARPRNADGTGGTRQRRSSFFIVLARTAPTALHRVGRVVSG
jgi:cyclophilin family peptidyl-prolyl cis-trans isomerase